MNSEPTPAHQWLKKLVGDWTYETEPHVMKPGEQPCSFGGTESVQAIGDLWTVAEGQGTTPGGGTAHTILTLGFDLRTNRYVGTWIGSMMSHLWVYDGELDATERILTLSAEGPHMLDQTRLTKYQDIIEFHTDDHRTLTAMMLGDDGTWQKLMRAHYHRKK